MLKKTLFLFLLLFYAFSNTLAQDFLKFYVKEERVKVNCQILDVKTVEKNSLLDLEVGNSFNALLAKVMLRRGKFTVEDKTLVLTTYKNKAGKVLKVVATSKVVAKNEAGKKVEFLAWTSNYYLEGDKYNNILIDQASHIKGFGEDDDTDMGWVLLDAKTGTIKAMEVNSVEQSKEDLESSEQNKMIGKASYQGALLFRGE